MRPRCFGRRSRLCRDRRRRFRRRRRRTTNFGGGPGGPPNFLAGARCCHTCAGETFTSIPTTRTAASRKRHRRLWWPRRGRPGWRRWGSRTTLSSRKTAAAIRTGLADIIAHPFVVPGGPWDFQQLIEAADPSSIDHLAQAAARAGVAMELNPKQLKLTPDAAGGFCRRLLEAGVRLAINSDAHHPRDVGCRSDGYAGEEELREVGVTEGCLWRIEDRAGAGRR